MEQNNPVLPKKVWSVLRLFYFMVRKGVSNNKIWSDLNMMMKRAKIAGKALQNHLFHHHHNMSSYFTADCVKTNTDIMSFNAAVLKAMEMIHSETTSPALPGFGRSPVVRQVRVTDSPFPLSNVDEDSHVDEAAEQFIIRFYNDLQWRRHSVPMIK